MIEFKLFPFVTIFVEVEDEDRLLLLLFSVNFSCN